MLTKVLKNISKDSAVYGFSQLLGRSIDLLTIPILTRIFTPYEYGQLDLIIITLNLFTILATAGTSSALFFYFYKENNGNTERQKSLLFSAVIIWNLFSGLTIASLIFLLSYLFQFNSLLFTSALLLPLCIYGFSKLILQRYYDTFRIIRKPWYFFTITTLTSSMTLIGLIYLWNQPSPSLEKYFWILSVCLIPVLLTSAYTTKKHLNFIFKPSLEYIPRILKFGLAIIPGSLAMFLLNFSDRWLIVLFNFENELGYYALGTKIAGVLTILITVLMQSFQPISMDVLHNNNRSEQGFIFDAIFRAFFGLYFAATIAIALLAPEIIQIISTPEYLPAQVSVGLLAFSSVMFGATYFTALGTWKSEKTLLYSTAVVLAGITNIILNLFLIPNFGIWGASISTALAMALLALLSFLFSQKLYHLSFSKARLLTQTILAFSAVVFISLNYDTTLLNRLAYGAIFILIMASISIKPSEIASIKSYLSQNKSSSNDS